jgi:curved DNA-binding protein CbpA
MDFVEIDGKKYDPYFILDVTKDDTNDHITRSFREKVKRYHPDKYTDPVKKKKYETYFKILSESYQYIKKKREVSKGLRKRKTDKIKDIKNMTSEELKAFNNKFENETKQRIKKNKMKTKDDNTKDDNTKDDNTKDDNTKDDCTKDDNTKDETESYQRLENTDDYEKFKIDIYNQFSDKKFTNDRFNKIFEHIKSKEEDQELNKVLEKSLIHKTTDGFRGYNSADFGSCALVSSFNGLLISGDTLADNGSGYWGSDYSDYNFSYKRAKNPNSKVIIKDDNKRQIESKIKQDDIIKYKQKHSIVYNNTQGNFIQQQSNLYQKIYTDLLEQEKLDETIVKKNISQYGYDTVQKALSGELETSQTYRSVLHKYIQ